jgi:hypothetical protein
MCCWVIDRGATIHTRTLTRRRRGRSLAVPQCRSIDRSTQYITLIAKWLKHSDLLEWVGGYV